MSRKRSRPSKSPRMAPLPPHHFMGPEVHRLAVISTGHVTRSTASEFETNIFTVKGTYGWLCYVPDEQSEAESTAPAPADLTAARRHGFGYILFDCDAPIISDLPYFEW